MSYFSDLFWKAKKHCAPKFTFYMFGWFYFILTWKGSSKAYPWSFHKTACQQNRYRKWGPPKIFYSLTSKLNWDVENICVSPSFLSPPTQDFQGISVLVLCLCLRGKIRESGAAFFFFFSLSLFKEKRENQIFSRELTSSGQYNKETPLSLTTTWQNEKWLQSCHSPQIPMKHARKPAESSGEAASQGPQMWPPESLLVLFRFKVAKRGRARNWRPRIYSPVITSRVMMELISNAKPHPIVNTEANWKPRRNKISFGDFQF